MSDPVPASDRPSAEGTDAPQGKSKRALVLGILVMLLPALVPLYFGLVTEGMVALVFFIAAAVVALMNSLMVYGLWAWVNSQSDDPEAG